MKFNSKFECKSELRIRQLKGYISIIWDTLCSIRGTRAKVGLNFHWDYTHEVPERILRSGTLCLWERILIKDIQVMQIFQKFDNCPFALQRSNCSCQTSLWVFRGSVSSCTILNLITYHIYIERVILCRTWSCIKVAVLIIAHLLTLIIISHGFIATRDTLNTISSIKVAVLIIACLLTLSILKHEINATRGAFTISSIIVTVFR